MSLSYLLICFFPGNDGIAEIERLLLMREESVFDGTVDGRIETLSQEIGRAS